MQLGATPASPPIGPGASEAQAAAPGPAALAPAGPALRRRQALQWLAWALGLALIVALVLAELWLLHAQRGAEQEERLRQQTRQLDQAIMRQIEAIDAGLLTVVRDLPAWTAEGNWANASRRLAALDSATTGARTLVLVDAKGRVYASSRDNLVGLDSSARDYFRRAREGNDPKQLYISTPFRTSLGVWSLNLSRALHDAEGRFAGVVAATLDPEWLAITLGTGNYAPDMWAALAHGGGRLLLMTPRPPQGADGADLARPGSMFARHRDSGLEETVFSGRIAATGEGHRVISQRTLLSGRPFEDTLVLALSRDLDVVYAPWRDMAWGAAALLALLVGLSATGLAAVQRSERRTARTQADAATALQALERRWSLALASSGLGVWDADLQTGREFHSAGWRAMLGLPAVDTVVDGVEEWRSRVHPDDLAPTLQRLYDHLEGRSPSYSAQHRMRHATGEYRWMLASGQVVERAPDGRALRVVGTLIDETDRIEAEQLRAARDRAEAESRAKTEFLSRMSHEMRTPLNAVLGFTQLLALRLGESDIDEQRRQLGLIEQGGRHLLALVNDVLDLARIESGPLPLATEPLALAPLLRAELAAMANQASGRGLQLSLVPVPAQAWVAADRRRLHQVLDNLLTNAVKYNREGGTVTVSVQSEGGEGSGPAFWRIAVRDTGPGLDATQQAHLFEPFNRLGQTGSAISGSGLGLVLVRWFVERMGGHVTVHSEPGQGSTFSVSLPAAAAPAVPLPASAPPPAP